MGNGARRDDGERNTMYPFSDFINEYNLLKENKESEYVLTGYWSKKAIMEAQKFSKVHISTSGEDTNFTSIPTINQWSVNPNSSYLHYTANETIEGIEFNFVPNFGSIPVISDMSSNFLSI